MNGSQTILTNGVGGLENKPISGRFAKLTLQQLELLSRHGVPV